MDAIEARPKNFGPMRDASGHAKIIGPCGDTVEVWLRIDGGKVRKGSFMSDGCGHSQHCCSVAVKLAAGVRLAAVMEMTQEEVLALAGEIPQDHRHCALLAANTIKAAVENYYARAEKRSLKQKIRRWFGR